MRGRPRSSALSGTIRVPLRVLFADPNPEMLDNWRRTIGEELAAEYVSRGDHALNAVLSDKRPEVIVANLVLSGTSGPELYRCTRAVDPVLAQRFIFVSDAPLTEEQAAFLNEFQVPVFHRPFPPKRLLHTILRGDSQRKTGR